MTRVELTVYGRSGRRRDLRVDAHPQTTWATVLADVVTPGTPVYVGADRVDLARPVTDPQLRTGDVVTVGEPGPARAPWPLTRTALGIAGGADAGRVITLRDGRTTVGRDPGCDLCIADASISSHHATLEVHDRTVTLTDVGSTNGTWSASSGRVLPTNQPVAVAPGERLVLGSVPVVLYAPAGPDATVVPNPAGGRWLNRVTRFGQEFRAANVTIPVSDPTVEDAPPGWPQYVGSFAMLATGLTTALLYHNLLYAALGVLAPVLMLVAGAVTQRHRRAAAKARRARQTAAMASALADLDRAASSEEDHTWSATLDPARVWLSGAGPTRDLWSTDPAQPDALVVRVGSRERPATITVTGPVDAQARPVLRAAPVTVDLRRAGVVGIAGPPTAVAGAARALLTQLAASRSPADLAIVHVAFAAEQADWSWLRWLPHTRTLLESAASVSPDLDCARARLDELVSLLNQRQGMSGFIGSDAVVLPEVLVVADGASQLRRTPSLITLLREGPAVGIYVLALDERGSLLPSEATTRLTIGGTGTLESKDTGPVTGIVVDGIGAPQAEAFARAIADLTPLGGSERTALPSQVRLLDLIDLAAPTVDDLRARWSAGAEGRVMLGVDDNGRPTAIDLVHDGPHAVIAGATGAGKSELVRTLLIGLALSAAPDQLSLLLIDYKGGGAFGRLTHLPHVVAYADDSTLAGTLSQRLLDSLTAELDLRKALFRQAGNVEDLTAYRRARATDPGLPAVARLVVAVDEFAELKAAQPDFISGLVGVARTGRSLGIHLILATQQPQGVITSEIRSNANLRICLRVLDPATSQDLVGTPVAASFPNTVKGRAVWVSGEAPVVIQTAWASAPLSETGDQLPDPVVTAVPWASCGRSSDTIARAEDTGRGPTELSRLVELAAAAADTAAIRPAHRPFLPPLPERVLLSPALAASPTAVGFGLEDHPRRQCHTPLLFDLARGNVGIVGGRMSGRSTALRTLAVALAQRFSADDLHLYVIDHAPASALRALGRLPHCGVVLTRAERQATARLVAKLEAEAARRSGLLAAAAAGSFVEVRATEADPPPWVVVMVDGWEALEDLSIRDGLVRLAEAGPAVGIDLVVTAGPTLRQPTLQATFADLLVARFDQMETMSDFGVPYRKVPAALPAGRCFRPQSVSRDVDACQVATLPGDLTHEAQNEAVRTLASAMPPARRHQPMRVVELPRRIGLPEPRLAEFRAQLTGRQVLIGVGGDDAAPRAVDLARTVCLVVAGPPGTGRTQVLATIAAQLADHGVPTCLWNARDDDLPRFEPGAVGTNPAEPVPAGAVVLVDDAHLLSPSHEGVIDALARDDVTVVLAGETSGLTGIIGWKARLGSADALLLSPRSADLSIWSVRGAEPFTTWPGNGYLVQRGRHDRVQVACTT